MRFNFLCLFLISRGNISLFRVSNHAVEGEARSFSLNSDFIFISLILLFIDQGDLLHSYYGYTKSSNLQVRFISDHASSVRLRLEFFVVIVRLWLDFRVMESEFWRLHCFLYATELFRELVRASFSRTILKPKWRAFASPGENEITLGLAFIATSIALISASIWAFEVLMLFFRIISWITHKDFEFLYGVGHIRRNLITVNRYDLLLIVLNIVLIRHSNA